MIDREELERMRGMNDGALTAMLRRAADAAGLDPKTRDRLLHDPEQIRKKLGKVTEKDLQRALSSLTPEQLAALQNAIKGEPR